MKAKIVAEAIGEKREGSRGNTKKRKTTGSKNIPQNDPKWTKMQMRVAREVTSYARRSKQSTKNYAEQNTIA